MSLIEYCTWKYKKSINAVQNAPQGSNQEAIEKAQKKMEQVTKALDEVIASIAKLKVFLVIKKKIKLKIYIRLNEKNWLN